MLEEAAGEGLVPTVGDRLVQLVHQDELLCEEQFEGAVARLEGGDARQDPIIELRLSSPRAKRAGLKGLCAESARAVTGRRCPHSGEGEDFLTGQLNFFYKTAVTPERKVKKSITRWKINRHAEG